MLWKACHKSCIPFHSALSSFEGMDCLQGMFGTKWETLNLPNSACCKYLYFLTLPSRLKTFLTVTFFIQCLETDGKVQRWLTNLIFSKMYFLRALSTSIDQKNDINDNLQKSNLAADLHSAQFCVLWWNKNKSGICSVELGWSLNLSIALIFEIRVFH